MSISLPNRSPSNTALAGRNARLTGRLPYLLLPVAVWTSTVILGASIVVRALGFGWSPLLSALSFVALAAAGGSVWLAWLVDHERFDFALGLHSSRPEDGEALLPVTRSVIGRSVGIVEERAFPRGIAAERFYGVWPGLRLFQQRVGFRSSKGLTFVFQSLTDPKRGHVVNATVLVRADPGQEASEGRRVLRFLALEWMRGEPVAATTSSPEP